MNEVGMLVDVSHCGPRTTLDAIELSPKAIAITHSNCRALVPGSARCKTDEAIKKYEDIRKRYATMPIIDDAKLSLARLYEKSNPTESFKIYEDLVNQGKANPNSGKAAEAGMRQEDLLKKNPELAKLREPIVPPTPPQPPVQITQMTNRPLGTNRTISLTNIIPRQITNAAGTPQIQVIPSPAPAGAPPTVTAPAPAPAPAPEPPK